MDSSPTPVQVLPLPRAEVHPRGGWDAFRNTRSALSSLRTSWPWRFDFALVVLAAVVCIGCGSESLVEDSPPPYQPPVRQEARQEAQPSESPAREPRQRESQQGESQQGKPQPSEPVRDELEDDNLLRGPSTGERG